ncbi:hypothetical protein ABPG74_016330 [Tetrahymena malaccensis]
MDSFINFEEPPITKPKLRVNLEQITNPPRGETRTSQISIEYNQPQILYDFRTKHQKTQDEKNVPAEKKKTIIINSVKPIQNESNQNNALTSSVNSHPNNQINTQTHKSADQDKNLDQNQIEPPLSTTQPAGGNLNSQEPVLEGVSQKDEVKQYFKIKEISLMRRRFKKFLKNPIVSWFFYIITWIYLLIMFVSISLQQLLDSDAAYLASVIINCLELFLLACLILEFLMTAYTQGFCNYFKVKLQTLDCIIIFLTLALVILDLLLGKSPQFTKIAAVAKGMFRFFRIILLFRKSNQFKKIKAASSIKTPAERIIDIFTDLKEFFDSKEIIEDIEWSIDVIASNKIYETKIVIQGAENNKEIVDWINYGARQKEEQEKQFDQDNILSNKVIDTKLQSYVNQIPQPIIKYFKDVHELSFDCFELEKMTKGQETSFLLLYLFQQNNILASVDIEPDILSNFFKQIEKGYKDNLYHNRLHAFDVLQTANFFLKSCNFIELAAINEFELCTIYISAACHDYDHPGVNNAFIINTFHDIALTYNGKNIYSIKYKYLIKLLFKKKDQSVLENHHASKTFQMFNDPNLDITVNFTKEQYRLFREMVISIILSTDMAKHFSDIAKLKSRLGTDDYDIKGKDKQMCIDTIIHACDVSNPVKTWNVYQQWAHKVLSEFWSQGDQERSQGLQITYLCDRYTTNTAKSQVGFIDFIVKPLYEIICNFLPELKNYMQQIDSNKQRWNELIPFYDQDLERIKNQIQQLQQSKAL